MTMEPLKPENQRDLLENAETLVAELRLFLESATLIINDLKSKYGV